MFMFLHSSRRRQGEWLKQNPERWESWLPNETACTSGKGLVNGSPGGDLPLGIWHDNERWYDGYWWLRMILDGFSWFLMVLDGSGWFFDGFWWLLMVLDGSWWFLMVLDGSWCFLISPPIKCWTKGGVTPRTNFFPPPPPIQPHEHLTQVSQDQLSEVHKTLITSHNRYRGRPTTNIPPILSIVIWRLAPWSGVWKRGFATLAHAVATCTHAWC